MDGEDFILLFKISQFMQLLRPTRGIPGANERVVKRTIFVSAARRKRTRATILRVRKTSPPWRCSKALGSSERKPCFLLVRHLLIVVISKNELTHTHDKMVASLRIGCSSKEESGHPGHASCSCIAQTHAVLVNLAVCLLPSRFCLAQGIDVDARCRIRRGALLSSSYHSLKRNRFVSHAVLCFPGGRNFLPWRRSTRRMGYMGARHVPIPTARRVTERHLLEKYT
jgi:hypothetical protein